MTLLAPPSTATGGRLRGVGSAQPSGVLTGEELGARVGRSAEWIETRTGIRELRHLVATETLIDLAVSAGMQAVAAAAAGDPHDAAEIDLVIAASCSNAAPKPPLAPQIASRLAPRAATMDLNAACSGFCYSLAMADALLRAGSASKILIVAAEHMTGIVDPTDVGTSIIFGDGAGAAVVAAATDGDVHIGPVAWGSDGSQAELITIPDGTRSLAMAGGKVFRWAIEEIGHVAREACERAGVTTSDIDAFVPHQANARIVDALATQLGMGSATVSRDVTTSGNTSAASIPLALATLVRGNAHLAGRLALLVGFGAGLAYAAQVVRLPPTAMITNL